MTLLKVLLLIPHNPVFCIVLIVADLGELYSKANSPKILPGPIYFMNLSLIITYTRPFANTHKKINKN